MTINIIRKKNILLLMPTIQRGGIENNLIYLSNYFIKNSCKCYLLTSNISNEIKKRLNKKVNIIYSRNYLNFRFINPRYNDGLNCFIKLLSLTNINQFKILSFQNHFLSVIGALLTNKKVIIRIANHPTGSVKFFQKKIFYTFKLFIKNFIYRFADAIVCNSNESKNYFRSKKFTNNVMCIFNPLILNNKKKITTKRQNYFFTAGRLENQKNIEGIIFAFEKFLKKFPKSKLIIIGNGSLEKKLKNYVKNNNLDKKISFKNFKNPEKYLKKCKAFILNSLFEGLPNVLLEALKYNTPIISTNCSSGPKEILENGKYGILTKVNDVSSLCLGMIKLHNNYEIYLKKAKNGNKSLARFEYDKQCKKYLQLISKIK